MSRLLSPPACGGRGDAVSGRAYVSPWRAGAIFTVLVLVSGVFVWKLVDLQLSPDDELLNNVGSYLREEKIEASRGNIVDRQGRLLAFSVPRPSIVGDPRGIANSDSPVTVDDIVAALATVLSADPEVMDTRLRSDKSFVYLERQVDPEVGQAVSSLTLPGIWIMQEQYRENPNGPCSALSVVGRVDTEQVGISGLEKQYDEQLEGSPGRALRQTQLGGAVQIPGGYRVTEAHSPGKDLMLSIDRNIQYEAEQILTRALQETEGTSAIAIVSNPRTGEIYAMASVLRSAETGEVGCSSANLGVVWVYEPGSTMKAITFAGVFDGGAWGVDTLVDVPATVEVEREDDVDNHVYRDYRIPLGETVANLPSTILGQSSNTGTVLLAQALGANGLQQTFENFGFGLRTALAFPGESRGILKNLNTHSLLLSNAAIGQSVAVTPLQLIQAYNTLANGGVRVEPTLVLDNEDVTASSNTAVRVVSEQSALAVMEMLRGVVGYGTGRRGALPGYVVAGKTGTSWQPCDYVGGYLCGEEGVRHYTASFVGIVENDQGPVLSAIVVIDDPQGDSYAGGSVAAPLFAELAGYSVRQLHLAPIGDGSVVEQRIRSDPAVAQLAIEPETETPGSVQ